MLSLTLSSYASFYFIKITIDLRTYHKYIFSISNNNASRSNFLKERTDRDKLQNIKSLKSTKIRF